MRKPLPMNSRTLFVQLGLFALLGSVISVTYANSNNSTYSDAVFAANAVKVPVVQEDDDNYSSYNYRGRYAEMSAARLQKQKADEEQKAHDAQISSIPRANESDAEYQTRMEKEQNPVWLKRQAQAKLQAQILDQQEAKQNQQAASISSNNLPSVSGSTTPTNTLNTSGLAENQLSSNTASLESLSVGLATPKTSPDSIPRIMSMDKYIGYSLFYWVGILWSLIFFVGLMGRRNG